MAIISYSAFLQRKVKLQNVSNDKSKRVNVLLFDQDAEVSTATSLSDLRIRGQRSKKGQITKYVKWQK